MVYTVSFSERANNELTYILNYIEQNWSIKIAKEFADKLNQKN